MVKLDPIVASFDRLVVAAPGSPLVVSRTHTATREDIDSLSRAAGTALVAGTASAPPRRGALVVLTAPNGPGFLAALLATRRAGLVAVLADAATPEAEQRKIAGHLGASVVLRARARWPRSADDFDVSLLPVTRGTERILLPGIAVVKLTSGSTGEPRGIATPAEALAADEQALFDTMGLSVTDRTLAAIPMSHSYGLSSIVLPALCRGMPIVMPEDEGPYSPLLAAGSASATVFPTVPSILQALVRIEAPPRLPDSLRLVISAGAPLTPGTAARFRELYGLPAHVFYGASECGGICYDREGLAAERGTVGTPVDGVSIRLASGLKGGTVDPEEGTVTVRSRAVAVGYVPNPDARLRDGVFASGDIGTWRGGELALVGRSDDVINVRGRKVIPREVESVLEQLESVKEVVVVGVRESNGGGETIRAVIACDRSRVTYDRVADWCRSRLPAHKVPRSILLVDDIPRTERGKLDRAALAAPDSAGRILRSSS